MDPENSIPLQTEFQPAAAQPGERVTVTLEIAPDLLDWLKAQPLGWQREFENAASRCHR